jgi:hypothetical protein
MCVAALAIAMAAEGESKRSMLYVKPAAPPDAAEFREVESPGVQFQPNQAQATPAPWIDSNAWRFQRGIRKANYAKLAAGAAALAAAEAFVFHVDAVLNPDPADAAELERMLTFLKAQDQPDLPAKANIGVLDDGSDTMGEVLNMLTRRNLLYRVIAKPDPKLDLNVRLGSPDFPKEAAGDPSDFAARVRAKLGDDKRMIRLYGTNTAIAHLTGDARRARLFLLSYSRNRMQQGIRVRVAGRYKPAKFSAYGAAANAQLVDVDNPGNATEFSIPQFSTIAIVDLDKLK